jgi:prepilin-type processing-associated H-X9-DG protein
MFANENKGWMPAGAGTAVQFFDSSGVLRQAGTADIAAGAHKSAADWIAWLRAEDEFTRNPNTGAADQNITYSGLAKYMGVKSTDHTTADQAHNMANKLEEVYRCPSDNLEQRPKNSGDNNGGRGPYRYSYSMNNNVRLAPGNLPQDAGWPALAGPRPPGNDRYARVWGRFTGKISSIRKSSDIVLFVCEDELSLDDGIFSAAPYNWTVSSGNATINAVAARHQLRRSRVRGNNQSPFQTDTNEDARGNVSFCDGHAEFFTRIDALRAKHAGQSYPDPETWPFKR